MSGGVNTIANKTRQFCLVSTQFPISKFSVVLNIFETEQLQTGNWQLLSCFVASSVYTADNHAVQFVLGGISLCGNIRAYRRLKPTFQCNGFWHRILNHLNPSCSKLLLFNPSFLIFDIRALWRSGVSARAPECQLAQLWQRNRASSINDFRWGVNLRLL